MSAEAAPTPQSALDFLRIVEKLKTTPRTGWVRMGVQGPESIADHMYRMSVMAMLMAGSTEVDQQRLTKMAVVHDIAEALVGDITPVCNVSKEEKHAAEAAALRSMLSTLGEYTAVAKEISELWWEYETGETADARMCKDFDKLEMIMQAAEYEHRHGCVLQEFFDSTAGKWQTAWGRAMAEEIVQRRASNTL